MKKLGGHACTCSSRNRNKACLICDYERESVEHDLWKCLVYDTFRNNKK